MFRNLLFCVQGPFSLDRLHFICDRLGCKLWLWSIQNHAWHCFQAYARWTLKFLCCLIRIWADALSLGRLSTWICCFAQDSIRNMWFCSYVIFRDQWMIARLSGAMGEALVSNNFRTSRQFYQKISVHMKQKVTCRGHYESCQAQARQSKMKIHCNACVSYGRPSKATGRLVRWAQLDPAARRHQAASWP